MAEENSAPPQGEERGSAQKGANVQGEALPQGETRALGETGGKGEAGGAELMDTTDAPKQGLSLLLASAELISQGAEAEARSMVCAARLGVAEPDCQCCAVQRGGGRGSRTDAWYGSSSEKSAGVGALQLGVAVPVLYGAEEGEQHR
ncbi:unnamed protein product [Closterium sp. NIES-65]|nr:unnamed protein product [Closterium sp. NIES-65]